MISYTAFGFRLDSDFEIPELSEARAGGDPAWRIAVGSADQSIGKERLLGTDSVSGTIQVRAYASPSAIRLVYDDTGTFEIRRADRTITWHPGPAATDEAMRADLLGRVIAFAAHGDGALALHASAVCIDGRAIAFVGPKGVGKSTLAFAFVTRGARLITDDTLIVRFDAAGASWAVPGLQRVRLWQDSARALGATATANRGTKPALDMPPAERRQGTRVPLEACYILRPIDGAGGAAREQLSDVCAAVACVSFSKLGSLAGGEEAIATLDRCARVARAVPVYTVNVPRDLSRLDEITADVFEWHRQLSPNATRGG
jgi:hypothetical protein